MDIIHNIYEWKETAAAATVGFFDGVHPGHRFLIGEMKRMAVEKQLPAAVVTFPVHPRVVLQSDYRPELLNTFDEKMERLASTGVDYAIVMNFTPELASLEARRFIVDVLAAQWRVVALAAGYDHRFGKQRTDGYEQYVGYGQECGMDIVRIPQYAGEGEDGAPVSSSAVRKALLRGEVRKAARLLGYRYCLAGRVVEGHRIGRTIGFPTANIAVDDAFKLIPASGVYAVRAGIDGIDRAGMLHIGTRPTFSAAGKVGIEVNIFDFSADVYGRTVVIEFVDFIRANARFNSSDDLRRQLHADRQRAVDILRNE